MLTILLGNAIVLVPMILNAHAGTKYGVSFPVLCRASFGVKGANVPAMLRALVACGWFGIQTWIGGLALNALLAAAVPAWAALPGNAGIAFAIFWIVQVAVILRGLEGIKTLESWSAPLLLGGGALLLWWAVHNGGGLGRILANRLGCRRTPTPFWQLFPAALTANVGYWATLSLNIPDFTRYARSQRSQALGQALGLPATMTAFAFIGVAVTSATIVLFGEAIWDPVVADRADRQSVRDHLGAFIVLIAQLTTNMAANVVSPANDFSSLAPRAHQLRRRRPDYRRHRHCHDAVEALRRCRRLHLHVAHRLLEPDGRHRRHPHRRLLGAAAARAVACRTSSNSRAPTPTRAASTTARWRRSSCRFCRSSLDSCARRHTAGGQVPNPTFLDSLYTYAWFVTFAVSFLMYLALMSGAKRTARSGGRS